MITYDQIRNLTIDQTIQNINSANKIKINKLKVFDLTVPPLQSHIGVYIIFNECDQCAYVGKTSSKGFVERIPAHFDTRESAWHNHLLKKIMREHNLDIIKALNMVTTFRLLTIPVDSELTQCVKLVISELENVLRSTMQPIYNSRKKAYDKNLKLSSYTEDV